jgi:hypothetical protein
VRAGAQGEEQVMNAVGDGVLEEGGDFVEALGFLADSLE